MTRTLACLAILTLTASVAQAARTHDVTAADYFSLAHVYQVAAGPKGRSFAYSELRWERGHEARNVDIWRVDRSGARQRLTFDRAMDHKPTWSADGRWIYFLSRGRKSLGGALKKTQQVWRVRPDGTGLMAVTRQAKGVEAFQLGARGKILWYVTAKKHVSSGPLTKLKKRFAKLQYGSGVYRFTSLWRLDLNEWRSKKVCKTDRVIRSFDVSADGGTVAAITAPSRRLIDNEGWSKVELLDVSSGRWSALPSDLWRKKAPSPYGWLTDPELSPDGAMLSFRVSFDGYPSEAIVVPLRGKRRLQARKLPRDWLRDQVTLSGPTHWTPSRRGDDRRLCVKAIYRARHGVYCWDEVTDRGQESLESVTARASGNVYAYDLSADGDTLAVAMSDLTHPPDVFALPSKGTKRYKRLTRVNPQVDTWKLPQIETVRWKSPDGTSVEGILELPPGYKKGSKALPTVVELHGGPTSATALEFRFWIYGRTLFASRGWALLSPNYRGSTGYGDRFLTELIGHKNDRDVADILAGVDHLVRAGIADGERLAVMGWSNGGYLTNCLITRTQRFKAASSGAGVFDTAMQWMIEDTPGHVINYNKGLPWTASEAMKKSSPLYQVNRVKTPTLIHVGENDPRVPVEHSRALFRSLTQYLKVPAELVVYPGTGHGLRAQTHRKAKMAWDIGWFDRWVLKRGAKSGATGGKAAAKKPPKPKAAATQASGEK